MGKVITELSVSLDGFVAGPNDGPELPLGEGGERLFAWYSGGDTALPLRGTDMVFHVSRASADYLLPGWEAQGAMVTGRRMFDIAGAWGGKPPGGPPCFVVTHAAPQEWVKAGSPFTFVTDGVESAIGQAQAAAGDKIVSVSSASIMQQCIAARLLDEVWIDLVPVLLGDGVRLFDRLGVTPLDLERIGVVAAPDVTHLRFRIVR
jgi:dihydrofolate reductase